MHTLAERSCGLGIVAEAYRVPANHPNWVKSTDGSAAITRRNVPESPPLTLIRAGRGFTVASWGPIVVIGVYLPPSLDRRAFSGRLQILEQQVGDHYPR